MSAITTTRATLLIACGRGCRPGTSYYLGILYRELAQTSFGRRLRRVARQAPMFREGPQFFVDGMREPPGIRRYHLRHQPDPVWLRHPIDSWTFHDIFVKRVYAIPAEVVSVLPDAPSLLDLGANVGLFGLFARHELPAARITGYEPDPTNLTVLRRNVDQADWYTVVEAAAGATDERVLFAAGLGDASHEADDGIAVEKHDVLPRLAACDLAKIDIEGGEWEILRDPRLAEAGPAAIVLEYHAVRCPAGSAHQEAARLLTDAGYRVVDTSPDATDGLGTVWALRASP